MTYTTKQIQKLLDGITQCKWTTPAVTILAEDKSVIAICSDQGNKQNQQNARFIAASPTIIKQLLKENKELGRELDKTTACLVAEQEMRQEYQHLLEENERLKAELEAKDRDETEREIVKACRERDDWKLRAQAAEDVVIASLDVTLGSLADLVCDEADEVRKQFREVCEKRILKLRKKK